MANAGTVNVNLVAKTAAFHSAMEKAEGTLHKFHSTVETGKHLLEAYLGYEAIAHIAEWVHHTMEAVEHQTKLAQSLGVSTEAMQALTYSTTLAHGSTEQLGTAMLKMEENLSGVGGSAQKTRDALAAMGMSMRDMQGKSGDEQLAAIADGLQKVSSSGDRAKIAVDLFGKAGAQMLPLLAKGSEHLREQAKEAEALGVIYSSVDAAKIEAANESLEKASMAIQGGLVQATKELSPLIETLVNYFLDLIKQSGGFGAIATAAMEYVVQGIGIAAGALNVLKTGWYAIESAVAAVTIGILELAENGVRNFLTLGQIVGNFGIAISDTASSISAEFSLAWNEIKSGVAGMTQYAGKEFAGLLDVIANGLRAYSDTAADAVMTAAGKVRAATGTMAADSKAATEAARTEADNAMRMASNSWSSMFETSGIDDNPLVKMLEKARVSATHFGEEAAGNFVASWDKVLNKDGSTAFNAFYDQISKASQKHAQEEADEKARQLAESRALAAEKLAVDTELAEGIKATLNEEVLAEDEAYTKRLADLKRYHDEALLSDAEFKLAEKQAQSDHEVTLAGIHKTEAEKQAAWDKKTTADKLDAAGAMFGNLATLMNSHSRRAFEIGKLAAYAQAIVTTAAGIARQFADLPIYLAIPAAAAVAIAGGVQIASIASTHFDGGGGTSTAGPSAGGSLAGASGTAYGPSTSTPGVAAPGTATPTLHINVEGLTDDMMVSGLWMRKFVDSINEAQTNGSPIATVGSV